MQTFNTPPPPPTCFNFRNTVTNTINILIKIGVTGVKLNFKMIKHNSFQFTYTHYFMFLEELKGYSHPNNTD